MTAFTKAFLPLVKHDATYDIWNSICHQQLTVEWLAVVFGEFFSEDVDFLDALFLYQGLPNTKVSHGWYGKFPCELPVMEVENDTFTLNDSIDLMHPVRALTEEFRFLHQSFFNSRCTVEYDDWSITES